MIKITVVKKILIDELISEFDDSNGLPFTECDAFEVGQEFIYNEVGDEMPKGFCATAWHDIFNAVMLIGYDAIPEPRLKNPHSTLSSCTEGLRSVIFKIEKI